MSENNSLLSVRNLSVSFFAEEGVVRAAHKVSFSIKTSQTFGLVGESGCGKSSVALSIMRLIPANQGQIVGGEIAFDGQNLLELSEKQMRRIRGNKIAIVFQEPTASLNPVYTVGDQIAEAIMLHKNKDKTQAWKAAVEMLRKVGIKEPQQRISQYPHQMSGGMQQRAIIAIATSCEPALLIADEPTTALDMIVQTQILNLLDELQKQTGMSILLITHDLGIAAERADEVAVMYASRIVEKADPRLLFSKPLHPYTEGLLKALPRLGQSTKRLETIPGTVAEPMYLPSGCKFHPRCRTGCHDKHCQTFEPELKEVEPARWVACWHAPGYQ